MKSIFLSILNICVKEKKNETKSKKIFSFHIRWAYIIDHVYPR